MLSFSPATSSPYLITNSQFSNFETKTHNFNLHISPLNTHLPNGFCLYSLKDSKNGLNSALETESFDNFDKFHFPAKNHKFSAKFSTGFCLFSLKSAKHGLKSALETESLDNFQFLGKTHKFGTKLRPGFRLFSLKTAKNREKSAFETDSFDAGSRNPFSPKTRKFSTKLRPGFRLFSVKSTKNGENSALEFDDFEEFDDFDDFDDEDVFDEDEDEDENEEGDFVPLRSMKKWLVEKPRGFGDGKEYDTSVEDKLLEEIQQSREAQLANVNKLKNKSQISNTKIGVGIGASAVVSTGIRVRLSNLPKKKNIDRDLKRAFKGIPGIINIIPAVSGNLRTRDPICKGFAFVDLKSEDYAHRFAKVVSGQSISFGKMEKQITCDVMSSKPQQPALEQLTGTNFGAKDSSSDIISSDYNEGTNENVRPTKLVISSKKTEDNDKKVGQKNLVKTNGLVLDSKSSKQLPKVVSKEKKKEGKQLRPKVPKLNIPGSANRLKVREKAMLTGVLSKYAAASSALQEQS